MTIKQFNGTYFLNEDRILFRFNTQTQEEYRFWFTRHVTLFILAATTYLLTKKLEQTHSTNTAKAISEFEKEAILDSAKSENKAEQSYETGLQFPLGFDPILVMDVSCSLMKNGEKLHQIMDAKDGPIDAEISIDFVLPGGANLNLKLAQNTLQTMCVLLDQLRKQAGWGDAVLNLQNQEKETQHFNIQSSKNFSIH